MHLPDPDFEPVALHTLGPFAWAVSGPHDVFVLHNDGLLRLKRPAVEPLATLGPTAALRPTGGRKNITGRADLSMLMACAPGQQSRVACVEFYNKCQM
jgi:hypothetical protein